MEQPKIGVYVCDCGINIAATVNVPEVVTFAKRLPNVTVARQYKYMCSEPGQNMIKDDIQELGLNRVVVASCTPRMHETTFQAAVAEAGLNPYFFAMANIREHVSWVVRDVAQATAKAKRLVSSAVYRVAFQEPLEPRKEPVTKAALIVGGGSRASRQRSRSPTPATRSILSSGNPPSAGTWRNWTRRSPRLTVVPEFSAPR